MNNRFCLKGNDWLIIVDELLVMIFYSNSYSNHQKLLRCSEWTELEEGHGMCGVSTKLMKDSWVTDKKITQRLKHLHFSLSFEYTGIQTMRHWTQNFGLSATPLDPEIENVTLMNFIVSIPVEYAKFAGLRITTEPLCDARHNLRLLSYKKTKLGKLCLISF